MVNTLQQSSTCKHGIGKSTDLREADGKKTRLSQYLVNNNPTYILTYEQTNAT